MISSPTVFVLGAGASQPYGLPLGTGLRDAAIKHLEPGRNGNVESWFTVLGAPIDERQRAAAALRGSRRKSIDAFLETRPEFTRVGKMAMAIALIAAERRGGLEPPENQDWYQYVFSGMTDVPADRFHQNKVSFVTFNYDRSLQQYLHRSMIHAYGVTAVEAAGLLDTVEVVHVHGSLGRLEWELGAQASMAYGVDPDPSRIELAAKAIRIASEPIEDGAEDPFQKAGQLLGAAKRIYFLGFAYHSQNVQRLLNALPSGNRTFKGPETKSVRGNVHTLLAAECEAGRVAGINLMEGELDNLRFVRTYAPLT